MNLMALDITLIKVILVSPVNIGLNHMGEGLKVRDSNPIAFFDER